MYAGGEKNLRDQGQFSRALPSVEGFASTYHRARSRGRWWCRPAGVRGCGLSEIQSWLQLVLSPFPCLPPGFLFWGQGQRWPYQEQRVDRAIGPSLLVTKLVSKGGAHSVPCGQGHP